MDIIDGFRGNSVNLDFTVGSIIGTRSFRVKHNGEVSGVAYSTYNYVPGENAATCPRSATPAPDHPMNDCEHGFWGYFNGKDDFSTIDTITGVLEGYGEVIIGSEGFRASKARIVGFVEPSGRWKNILGYDKVRLFTTFVVVSAVLIGLATVAGGLATGQHNWGVTIALMLMLPVVAYQELAYFLNYRTAKKADAILKAGANPDDIPFTKLTGVVKEDHRTQAKFKKVMMQYPDIPVFSSYEELLAAYPQILGERKGGLTYQEEK